MTLEYCARQASSPYAAAVLLLAMVSPTAAQSPSVEAPASSTPLLIRWASQRPETLLLQTDDVGEVRLVESGGVFRGATPPSRQTIVEWPLVARYGGSDIKLILKVRHSHPGLDFQMENPGRTFCHEQYVRGVEQPSDSMRSALRALLEAHFLLKLGSPNQCTNAHRARLIRARYERNADLVREAGYFAIVPQYRDEYAQLAGNNPARLAVLQRIDNEALAIEAKELYNAQLAAQKDGRWNQALAISEGLAERKGAEPAFADALLVQRIDDTRLTTDAAYLRTRAEIVADAVESESSPVGERNEVPQP